MKKIWIGLLGLAVLGTYPSLKALKGIYVQKIVNASPRPTSMYRIVTSNKDDWVPSRRIFVQGYFSSSGDSEASLWVSEKDAELSIMGARVDIVDDRIVSAGCYGKHVFFVGMLGMLPGGKNVVLYDTEQIYLIGKDFPMSHMSPEALEYSATLNCYLDIGSSDRYLTKYGIRKPL